MATTSATDAALVWFRRDLRLADNPALHAAVQSGRPLVLLFIDERDRELGAAPGEAADWWLHGSLAALARSIAKLDGRLQLRRGDPAALIPGLVEDEGIGALYFNRSGELPIDQRDRQLCAALRERGVDTHDFRTTTLLNPDQIFTGSGKPYKVFSAFWRTALKELTPPPPLPAPSALRSARQQPASEALSRWQLRPVKPDWAGGLAREWTPGEHGAATRLGDFLSSGLSGYVLGRDRPDQAGTSRLSPHLAFGEISPRQLWHALQHATADGAAFQPAEKFLAELGWRDFAYYLAHHFGDIRTRNFNTDFDHFPWQEDSAGFRAWCQGRTGVPMVDAGMRQLWMTGWMHNRVRMVCASFLVKNLRCDWRLGLYWFESTLVDADRAVNAASWQWVAGSGADAAPYFRIFNPVRQGERFDPDGAYVRQWMPELRGLPTRRIHAPWTASTEEWAAAGLQSGQDYPDPIRDLSDSRDRALRAYQDMKRHRAAASPA